MERVDIIDVLFALVNLSFHPVPVKVPEKMVDVFGGSCVASPFPDIETQQGFFAMCL